MAKVIVITGASAGVGRATVRELAQPGVSLALIARGRDGLKGAQREAQERGAIARIYPLDVSQADQVEEAAGRIEEELGSIGLWINNAMTSVFSPVKWMTPEEYRRVTEVTYLGYVYGTLAALKRMLPRDQGVILQVGSAPAYRSIPLQSAYCGAKHAIHGFTESLRVELLHDKSRVKVTEVHLPAVNTPQFDWVRSRLPCRPQPVPPIYQPEFIARAIRWVSEHPEKKETWLAFSTTKAILSDKISPRIGDWYLARTGYRSQQTDEKDQPRADNLWSPLPGDAGAHGRFDQRAKDGDWQLWWLRNKRKVQLAGAAALLVLGTTSKAA